MIVVLNRGLNVMLVGLDGICPEKGISYSYY